MKPPHGKKFDENIPEKGTISLEITCIHLISEEYSTQENRNSLRTANEKRTK
jgi:hypothetical protein